MGFSILATLVIYAYTAHIHAVKERPGWFLLSVMLLLSSLQILLSGILAEILARIHYGVGNRRIYNVRREWTGSKPPTG